jgi:hypothetical protein
VTVRGTAAHSRGRVDVGLVDAISALLVADDEDAVVSCAVERAALLFDPVVPEVQLHAGGRGHRPAAWCDADVIGPSPDGGWTVVVPLRGREGDAGDLLLHRPPGTSVHSLRAPAAELGRHVGINLERVRRRAASAVPR